MATTELALTGVPVCNAATASGVTTASGGRAEGEGGRSEARGVISVGVLLPHYESRITPRTHAAKLVYRLSQEGAITPPKAETI